MSAIVWSDVVTIASGLSGIDGDAQDIILGYVNERHNVSLFGGEDSFELKLLRMMLAAHIASSATTEGSDETAGGGLVTGESIGKMSRSYTFGNMDAASSDAGLQTTGYGRQYRTMIRGSAARVGFAF
jgi:hypothetical protein